MTTSSTARGSAAYTAAVADSAAEVRAAQRLRHQVFGEEMGAAAGSCPSGLDMDAFDSAADHLIVTDTATGDVVGTYRLLPPGRVRHSYADGEFDLAALAGIRTSMIEAGRSCVHPDHRSGAVINLMWSALARYPLRACVRTPLPGGLRLGTAGGRRTERGAHVGAVRGTPCAALRHGGLPAPTVAAVGAGADGGTAPGPAPRRSRRCCADICGWARGCAERPPTTRSSASRTSSWCSTWSS